LCLNKGGVQVSAQQGIWQVSEKLFQQSGGVVGTKVRTHFHVSAAVKIFSQLVEFGLNKLELGEFFMVLPGGLAFWNCSREKCQVC